MNSRDKEKNKIVSDEIKNLGKLIEGHRNLLEAIGNLWFFISIIENYDTTSTNK